MVDNMPDPKKRRLSLKRKQPSSERFTFTSSLQELEPYKTKCVPKNTEKTTQWALKVFVDWKEAHEQAGKSSPPADFLEDLCNWLCTFFAEVKKSDGTEYCPRSVSGLLSGIQRYIESKTGEKVNFQDETEFS